MQEVIPYNIFENDQLVQASDLSALPDADYTDKRVLIFLVPHQNIEEQRIQIEKIFAACKINSDSILIVNKELNWSGIQKIASIKEVFLFGVHPKNIGILYTLFPYKFLTISGKKVVLADSLDMIMSQAQLKNDFWHNCLKPYYVGV